MATPPTPLDWEPCPFEAVRDAALEGELKRDYGGIAPWHRYLAACPGAVKVLYLLYYEHGLLQRLDFELADLLSLVVSQDNSCRFCYAVHRALLRVQGMSEPRVRELESRLAALALDARTAAAVRFARKLSRSAPRIGRADVAALAAAGFAREEILEIAGVAAFSLYANRLSTFAAIAPGIVEWGPRRWYFGLLRPLLRRLMLAQRRRGQAQPPPAYTGLFAGLVRACGTAPVAGRIADSVDALWSSPQLGQPLKALMVAVIARGLGCEATEHEARAAAASAGLAPAAVHDALAHLRTDALDERDNRLLAFARETLWYQPVPVQRRVRGLMEHFPQAPLTEALAVAALANALCRWRAVTEALA